MLSHHLEIEIVSQTGEKASSHCIPHQYNDVLETY